MIKQHKLLAVDQMMGYDLFQADGAIGLGYIQDLSKPLEQDTNFIQSVFIKSSEEQMPTKIMG